MNSTELIEMEKDAAEIKQEEILKLVDEIAFLVSTYGLDFEYRQDSEDFRDDVQSQVTKWLEALPWIVK